MREALQRKIPVVTSNKWPVALRGAELAALAQRQQVAFRAESTVMSGTPVLSTLTEGLAGTCRPGCAGCSTAPPTTSCPRWPTAPPMRRRWRRPSAPGWPNQTRPPTSGHDAVAKVMVLSALVFGRQLRREHLPGHHRCHRRASPTGSVGRGPAPARRDARVLRPRGHRNRNRPRAAGGRTGQRPAGRYRRRHQRPHLPGEPGRRDQDHRARSGPQIAGQGALSDIIAIARWQARGVTRLAG